MRYHCACSRHADSPPGFVVCNHLSSCKQTPRMNVRCAMHQHTSVQVRVRAGAAARRSLSGKTFPHSLLLLKNRTGTSTYRLRKNSAQFFPRKSTLLVLDTPLSSRLRNRKCTPLRLCSSNRSIWMAGFLELSYSFPSNSLILSTVNRFRSQVYSSAYLTQNPQLQSLPLSPERA